MFRKSLRTGIVTSGYPQAPEAAPRAFRGRPVYEPARCEGGGACERVCPSRAITISYGRAAPGAAPRVYELDYARCVLCGLCVDVCPSGALTQSQDFELAVKRREDLVVRVTFAGEPTGQPDVGAGS